MFRRQVSTIAICVVLPLALGACDESKKADPRNEAPLVRATTVQGGGSA